MRHVCAVDGCERPRRIRGLCSTHDQRRRRGMPLDAPIRVRRHHEPGNPAARCGVRGCYRGQEQTVEGLRVCRSHARRHRLGQADWQTRPMRPIRGRGPDSETPLQQVTIYLSASALAALEKLADARNTHRARIAREAVLAWLRAATPGGRGGREDLHDATAWARRALEWEA